MPLSFSLPKETKNFPWNNCFAMTNSKIGRRQKEHRIIKGNKLIVYLMEEIIKSINDIFKI